MFKRIFIVIVLAFFSMGGCDHSSDSRSAQVKPPDTDAPVVPAPAAVGLALFGGTLVIRSWRRWK